MKARSTNKVKEQPNQGNFLARVVGLANIGHQPEWIYQGETVESEYRLELTYELVGENMSDGRPFWVSEEVRNSDSSKSKLSTRYMATGADLSNLETIINKPVMVTLKHDTKGYAKVKNVSGVPTGIPVPELRNDPQIFDMYSDKPDINAFEGFSDFKKDKFRKALDFKDTALARALAAADQEQF